MKSSRKELDVDFIGEQGRPLTEEEAKAVSEYIKTKTNKRHAVTKKRVAKRKNR